MSKISRLHESDIQNGKVAYANHIDEELDQLVTSHNSQDDEIIAHKISTDHDARYYTKTQTDTEINNKIVEIGAGDMAKATYDADNDGKVDIAETVSDGAITTVKMADGAVTNDKLSTDTKVGSLANLNTTVKSSAVGAINEVNTYAQVVNSKTTAINRRALILEDATKNGYMNNGVGYNGKIYYISAGNTAKIVDMADYTSSVGASCPAFDIAGATYSKTSQNFVYEDNIFIIQTGYAHVNPYSIIFQVIKYNITSNAYTKYSIGLFKNNNYNYDIDNFQIAGMDFFGRMYVYFSRNNSFNYTFRIDNDYTTVTELDYSAGTDHEFAFFRNGTVQFGDTGSTLWRNPTKMINKSPFHVILFRYLNDRTVSVTVLDQTTAYEHYVTTLSSAISSASTIDTSNRIAYIGISNSQIWGIPY